MGAIINEVVPWEGGVPLGTVVEIMIANRLLRRVRDWAEVKSAGKISKEAVDKALAGLTEAERKRTQPSAAEMAMALESLVATHKGASTSAWSRPITPMQTTPALIDLVVEGIGELLSR